MQQFINSALEIAKNSLYISQPNPRVGCILVGIDGNVIGIGNTQLSGGPHAEIMALHEAATQGLITLGATAYVTLEPCSHYGRTGPCCNALITAGIKKVVASSVDPNPEVAGQGFKRLSAAGIEVEMGPGAAESRELNIGFFSRMVRKTPWVRMKIAASLDGTTALANNQSQWITSAAARADGHAWRARACTILTGIGTVLQDDPHLDAREVSTPRQPQLVLVDSQLQTPLDAKIFLADRKCTIYTAITDQAKTLALQNRGAEVVVLSNDQGKVDLNGMLRDLGQREINELHVEAGSKLNGSLIQAGLVDEFLIYLAPKLLGPGLAMASLLPLHNVASALQLGFHSIDRVGEDIRIIARPPGRAEF